MGGVEGAEGVWGTAPPTPPVRSTGSSEIRAAPGAVPLPLTIASVTVAS